jgi:hypothetical protein
MTAAAGDPRLEKMEREVRRVRRLGTFLLVSMAVLLGLAAALIFVAQKARVFDRAEDLVVARRYVLRDYEGRIRGIWETTNEGAAQFIVADTSGSERLRFRVLEDGSAGLAMVDATKRARAVIAVLPDETTTLALADAKGRTRAVLGLRAGGAPSLVLAGADGQVLTGLGLESGGPTTHDTISAAPSEPR